ncbi:ankyrin repeat-containing domain protein [Tuber brumale]|nr:ankyrin repeat-containing domain protein [Tuber brumale]
MSIDSLPNEILRAICLLLSFTDQYSLLRTNRHLALIIPYFLTDFLFRSRNTINGRKALYSFASRNDTMSVHALLNRGILSFAGPPACILNMAIEKQNKIALQTLLDCGISANIPDHHLLRPLHFAVITEKVEMVQVLLSKKEYGVDINSPIGECITPLTARTNSGLLDVICSLEQSDREGPLVYFGISTDPEEHATPLILAVEAGFVEIVCLLLKSPDVDINTSGEMGCTALQCAIYKQDMSILQLLLADSRVDISTVNGAIVTPLLLAIRTENKEIVQLLLQDSRLNISAPIPDGITPLHEAVKLKDTTILKILLQDKRLNINAPSVYQMTPLHEANLYSEEAVKVLLEDSRIDVNARNVWGQTPLHLAARYRSETTIRMFLQDPRVDVYIRDALLSHTALDTGLYTRGGDIGRIMLEDQWRRFSTEERFTSGRESVWDMRVPMYGYRGT